jgi:hypothetical protein
MMAKVTVCRFKVYDITKSESFVQPRWATRETIGRIGATVIEPCIEIDEALLNGDGYTERDFEPG